jgi:hypothetical protein
MKDSELRDKWRQAGGEFYGPKVEHGSMEEMKLLRYLGSLYDEISRLRSALEPFSEYYDSLERNDRLEGFDLISRKDGDILGHADIQLRELLDAKKAYSKS